METKQRVKRGLSNNPLYDELVWKLSQLAGQWRVSKDDRTVQRYHHVLFTLMELGWTGRGHDALDVELELPDELMPPEYFQLFETEAIPQPASD